MRATDPDVRTASQIWTDMPGTDRVPRVIVFWNDSVVSLPLREGAEVTIGRAPECDVHVDHKSVSRRHACVRNGPGGVQLEDLGSANGTLLQGARLTSGTRVPLQPGSIAAIGLASLVLQPPAGADFRQAGAEERSRAPSPWPAQGPMARVVRLIELVAAGDVPVLLLGETGVGKELAAEHLHRSSPRRARPLVRVNCAALPEALLEAELFGYERGAFTGAHQAKPGLFEAASSGTLLLDEVGELPLGTQAKLLRVLDGKEVLRLGALQPRSFDVRIVAATNRDLAECVARGTFRQDLFYRLAGMPIELPPLRERSAEIEPLARELMARACERLGRPLPAITPAALAALHAHAWPGNVRELKAVMERAVLLCEGGVLEPQHLQLVARQPSVPPPSGGGADLRSQMKAFERQRIVDALEQTGGNQSKAARLLGIGRRTLIDKLAEHGLSVPKRR